MSRTKAKKTDAAPVMLHPDAAGIDVGATEIYVSVPLSGILIPCEVPWELDIPAPIRKALGR
jgi:hypothetical protein